MEFMWWWWSSCSDGVHVVVEFMWWWWSPCGGGVHVVTEFMWWWSLCGGDGVHVVEFMWRWSPYCGRVHVIVEFIWCSSWGDGVPMVEFMRWRIACDDGVRVVDVVMELVWLWSSCGDGGHVVMWWWRSCGHAACGSWVHVMTGFLPYFCLYSKRNNQENT